VVQLLANVSVPIECERLLDHGIHAYRPSACRIRRKLGDVLGRAERELREFRQEDGLNLKGSALSACAVLVNSNPVRISIGTIFIHVPPTPWDAAPHFLSALLEPTAADN
jgi:hypothetical protein